MKTMVLDMSLPRLLLTRFLGRLAPSAYFWPTSPLRLAKVPDPPLPADDWVRVSNRLCGICGSDLHQVFLDAGLDVAPVALPSHQLIYLGHEMVGEVVEVGKGAPGYRVGDRVVRWGRADDCRAKSRDVLCQACARGHRVLCQFASEPSEHRPVGGGYGDSFITPASTLLPVLEGLSDEQAIFTEPVAVAIHAAWRRKPETGDRVLVLGCGTIGYLLIQVLRVLQPECEIIAVAQFPWQAEMARWFGAHGTFLTSDDGYREAASLTNGKLYQGRGRNRMLMGGFDLVFDVVGVEATLNDSLRWTRAGGAVVLVGVNLHRMKLDVTPVWYQEVDLIGAVGHDVVRWEGLELSTFELAMRWMEEGIVDVRQLLTHEFPLESYKEAFRAALDKVETHSVKVAFQLRAATD